MLKQSIPVLLLWAVSAFAVDVTTYHNDNARTGQNLNGTAPLAIAIRGKKHQDRAAYVPGR